MQSCGQTDGTVVVPDYLTIGDIRATLPQGVQGPFFNDEFGDTFGNIYALTGDGYTYAQLKDMADRIRTAGDVVVTAGQGLRINAVSPTILTESVGVYGPFFPGFDTVPAERAARGYQRSVEGAQTGRVYRVQ